MFPGWRAGWLRSQGILLHVSRTFVVIWSQTHLRVSSHPCFCAPAQRASVLGGVLSPGDADEIPCAGIDSTGNSELNLSG